MGSGEACPGSFLFLIKIFYLLVFSPLPINRSVGLFRKLLPSFSLKLKISFLPISSCFLLSRSLVLISPCDYWGFFNILTLQQVMRRYDFCFLSLFFVCVFEFWVMNKVIFHPLLGFSAGFQGLFGIWGFLWSFFFWIECWKCEVSLKNHSWQVLGSLNF